MSSQQNESFNLNLLHNAPADGHGTDPMATAEEGASFAAQLAGGNGGDFMVPAPRKSISKGTIVFVVVAALAGGSLWWMKQRTGGPAPAEAADPGVDAARASIQQFLAGGNGSVAEMKSLLADSEKITEKFASYSETSQVPLEDLKTNPFFDAASEDAAAAKAPRIDRNRQLQESQRLELERLTSAAGKFQVQTIFYGRNPTAMIDGTIVQVGQQIGEFTVKAITSESVQLAAKGHEFELRLKR